MPKWWYNFQFYNFSCKNKILYREYSVWNFWGRGCQFCISPLLAFGQATVLAGVAQGTTTPKKTAFRPREISFLNMRCLNHLLKKRTIIKTGIAYHFVLGHLSTRKISLVVTIQACLLNILLKLALPMKIYNLPKIGSTYFILPINNNYLLLKVRLKKYWNVKFQSEVRLMLQ